MLELHLQNLTSRNEHDTFEEFARRLCEVEVCPNIKPNSGPSGGGDGKTDAESYPVAEETASGWYVGYEKASSNNKLAFAFSAKKKWQPKVKADLEAISSKGKKFTEVYFVSNQYIKADIRKKIEQELNDKYKVDVHIFDLKWILDKVYNNDRLEIAISTLGIETSGRSTKKRGPIDRTRLEDLKKLDKKIEAEISKGTTNYLTARNAIESAILSREQELPRTEVDGHLERAVRLADSGGTKIQQFMARYQKCWTAFWWFEDFKDFKSHYTAAEKHGLALGGIDSLEKVSNLRQLLVVVRRADKRLVSKKYFDTHTKKLTNELIKFSKKDDAPSSALHAKTLLEQIKLADNLTENKSIKGSLKAMEAILTKSENLPGFPLQVLTEILLMLGEVLGYDEDYEKLFGKLNEVTRKRDGDISAGKQILDRARSLIEEKEFSRVIQLLGGALPQLHKHETNDEAAEALMLMGEAYEQSGLLWAARSSYLGAASLTTSEFYNSEVVLPVQLGSYESLMKIELLLGRVPQILQWYEAFTAFVQILSPEEWKIDKLMQRAMIFDLLTGATILTTQDHEALIASMTKPLEHTGLVHAMIAALYRTGQQKNWPDEFKDNIPTGELNKYLSGWAAQVNEDFTPSKLLDYESDTIEMRTLVAGCDITLKAPNEDLLIMTAETILASIESLMATVILHRGVSMESELLIVLKSVKSDKNKVDILHKVTEGSSLSVSVEVANFNPHSIPNAKQEEIGQSIMNLALDIFAHTVTFEDSEESLGKIFKSEQAVVRAIGFTFSYVHLGNAVGHKPKYRLNDWKKGDEQVVSGNPKEALPMGALPALERVVELEKVNQRDFKTLSVIRPKLWDQAGWSGVMYAWSLEPGAIPHLAIIVADPSAGELIMKGWREKYSNIDHKEEIHISIVKDIDPARPSHYRMGISANVKANKDGPSHVMSMTRVHTMTPKDTTNLEDFEKQFAQEKRYKLTIAAIDSVGDPHIAWPLAIEKREISIRSASDVIDENDVDKILLGPSEDID